MGDSITREWLEKNFKEVYPQYKEREIKRNQELSKQRINTTLQQFKRLSKIASPLLDKERVSRPFGWISNVVIDEVGLSDSALGLLGLLVVYAGKVPMYSNKLTVLNCTSSQLLKLLHCKSSNQKKKINSLLQELVNSDLIRLDGADIILTMGEISDYKDGYQYGFTKVYSSTVKKIVAKAKGMTLLKRLSAYVGFRSQIFESYNDREFRYENLTTSSTYHQTTALKINESIRTLRNHYKWFRENNILAYVGVKTSHKYHNTKYLYCEEHDTPYLMCLIITQLRNSNFLRLLG